MQLEEIMNKSFLTSNGIVKIIKNNLGMIVVLLVMCIVLSFLSPVFLSANNFLTLFRQISDNIYIALGMSLVIILGGIDLSVGSVVAMSGIITVSSIVNEGMPVAAAIALGLLGGLLCGLASGFLIAVFDVPPFIITLAMMNVARGISYLWTNARSIRAVDPAFNTIGTGYLGVIPLPVVYSVILIIVFSFLLNKTTFGTYVYAIGGNREAAKLSGVPIKRTIIIVHTISTGMAAFSGIVLAARMYSGQPSVGEGYEMDAITACVLGGISMTGGIGHISGMVIGAVIIGVISNGLNLCNVSSYWQLVVKGIIVAIAIIFDKIKNSQGKIMIRKKEADKQ